MFLDYLIYLPVSACAFWIVIYLLMASRTRLFKQLLFLMGTAMVYLFTDSCYACPLTEHSRVLVVTSILAQFTAPTIIPLAWMYLQQLRRSRPFQPEQLLWIVLPAMLSAVTLILTLMQGPEDIHLFLDKLYARQINPAPDTLDSTTYAYYLTSAVGFRAVLIFEAVVYGIAFIVMMRRENLKPWHLGKFFRGHHVRTLELQSFVVLVAAIPLIPKILLTRSTMMAQPWIAPLLAVLITAGIFLFCFTAMFGALKRISLREMASAFRFNYSEENKAEIVEEMIGSLVEEAEEEALKRIQEKIGRNLHIEEFQRAETAADLPRPLTAEIFSAVAKSWDDDSLLSRFERLIFGERLYLEPGLTLTEVAEKLHTNKTYISRLVNNTYNLAFPDLVNTLRVDYAEQYIIAHRDARQQEIASACGFTSASSFNNVFKKITGMTPKIWLVTYDSGQRAASGPDKAS